MYICTYMYIYIHIRIYIRICIYVVTYVICPIRACDTTYSCIHHPIAHAYEHRVAKTQRIPYLYRSSAAKEPYI